MILLILLHKLKQEIMIKLVIQIIDFVFTFIINFIESIF